MAKILVIDDDNALRWLMVKALRDNGFTVFEAADGTAGVRLARIHLPDLIISDVIMGGLDGYAVLQKIRQEEPTAMTPFILTTGKADLPGMRQGMSLGADDYLPKPFTTPEFLNAVRTRLQKQQSLRDEADQKLAELRASISMMLPHELLTPLNGILGIGEIMGMDPQSLTPAEIADFGEMIQLSGEHLHRLIKNFLIYAQIEILAKEPLKLTALRQNHKTDLAQVLEKVATKIAATMRRQDDLVIQTMPILVAAASDHIEKIAEELISNAFKFSPPGTPVQITTAVTEPCGFFAIADVGGGMKTEYLENIGAYMQFDRKLLEQRGSGLGLAIAKRLVDICGGQLHIETQAHKGTTVRVELPRS
jgi:two-component system sensor histidine kinase/response regulator